MFLVVFCKSECLIGFTGVLFWFLCGIKKVKKKSPPKVLKSEAIYIELSLKIISC